MKIPWSKLLKVAGQLVLAAPAIVDAVAPVLRKPRQAPTQPEPAPAQPDTAV